MENTKLGFRATLRKIVESNTFERGILTVIILNSIVLGLEVIPPVANHIGELLVVLNVIFTAVYVIEAAMKITAWGGNYFKDGWNIFDFVITITCLIPAGSTMGAARVFRVLRILRTLRVLRLVSSLRPLRKIVATMVKSLAGIGWTGVLLLVFYYIFAIIGIHLYGQDFPELFGGFPEAFITLFELTTLEGWQDVVKPVCATEPFAWIYFILVIVIAAFILLNLVLGIIVDAISEVATEPEEKQTTLAKEVDELSADIQRMEEHLKQMKKLLEQQEASETRSDA